MTKKFDGGKPPVAAVIGEFAGPLLEVAKVGQYGNEKYTGFDGWKKVENGGERYANAMLRHFLDLKSGNEIDADSGQLNAAMIAWNALALLHFELEKNNGE